MLTKQDISLGEKLRNTQIIINKQDGTITSLVETTETAQSTADDALNVANKANTKATATDDDLQSYKTTISSKFVQTATDYTMLFTQAQGTADRALQEEEKNLQERIEYIRFSGDTITLGKEDSPFTAELTSTELAFKQNGQKIAYISNNKLYITDAEAVYSIKIGNFRFKPRDNGSLSFGKESS